MTVASFIACVRAGKVPTRSELLDAADALEHPVLLVEPSEGHSADYWRQRAYDARDEVNALREAAKLAAKGDATEKSGPPTALEEAVLALLHEAGRTAAGAPPPPGDRAYFWAGHVVAVSR